MWRQTLAALLLTAAAGAHPALAATGAAALPPVRHVFVLVLENKSYEDTFGKATRAPYLARELPARGALLTQYYGIGHYSLPNYLALISGQAPNDDTQQDCLVFNEFWPASATPDADGQLRGAGCVYPATVRPLPDLLEAAGFTWRAYLEDMGNNPARERGRCAHVAPGAAENTDGAQIGDQYATKHNPFVYFHSLIDNPARCEAHVVNLRELAADLASSASTPNFVFITPNLCNDGHDDPCVDGRRGGLTASEQFLREWVPRIEASAAFRADGLLVITFDESASIGPQGARACCGERGLPGASYPPGLGGPGGGRIGAVLLSPFIRGGTVSDVPYNHYALLRTVAGFFGVAPPGFAAAAALQPLGADVFTAAGAPRPPARSAR